MSAAKRFYKAAGVVPREGAFAVTLDGRALRTPAGAAFVVPTEVLAAACAAEWQAQGDEIAPASMPLTRTVNVAIDRGEATRAEMAAHIARYLETDLVAHRAERPSGLVARQSAAWDPLIAWAETALGVRVPLAAGLAAAAPDAASLSRLESHLVAMPAFALVGVAQATGMAGSAVIALALEAGAVDGDGAYQAACLDEFWSLETWGEDAEARARLEHIRAEFTSLAQYFAALG